MINIINCLLHLNTHKHTHSVPSNSSAEMPRIVNISNFFIINMKLFPWWAKMAKRWKVMRERIRRYFNVITSGFLVSLVMQYYVISFVQQSWKQFHLEFYCSSRKAKKKKINKNIRIFGFSFNYFSISNVMVIVWMIVVLAVCT